MHMCYISTCAFMFNLQTVGSLSNICALWLQVGKIMMEYDWITLWLFNVAIENDHRNSGFSH